jgi:hypothetical protein
MPYKDPEDARAYQRERQRLRRAGERTTPRTTLITPIPFRLKTAHDVLALLEEQIGAVRATEDATTLEKARVCGFLGSIALRAIETGDLAARMEIIEAEMKQRRRSA